MRDGDDGSRERIDRPLVALELDLGEAVDHAGGDRELREQAVGEGQVGVVRLDHRVLRDEHAVVGRVRVLPLQPETVLREPADADIELLGQGKHEVSVGEEVPVLLHVGDRALAGVRVGAVDLALGARQEVRAEVTLDVIHPTDARGIVEERRRVAPDARVRETHARRARAVGHDLEARRERRSGDQKARDRQGQAERGQDAMSLSQNAPPSASVGNGLTTSRSVPTLVTGHRDRNRGATRRPIEGAASVTGH